MNATEIRSKIDEILSAAQVVFSVAYTGETKRDDWQCDAWRVKFTAGKQVFESDYFTGLGHRKVKAGAPSDKGRANTLYREQWDRAWLKPQSPKAADVLHSLALDAEADNMSFRDWCANFGYSDDSIDALEIYRQCCKTAEKLHTVFKPDTLVAIREAVQEL